MKKKLFLGLVLMVSVVMTGCGSDNNKTEILTCTTDQEIMAGTTMTNTYKVTYKGNYVELIETEEKVVSDNSEYLELVKEKAEEIYAPFKNVEHYEYEMTLKGDTLLSITKIDYSKIDYDDLVKANPAITSIMKNKKLKVSDVRTLYESEQIGATCK